MPYEKQNFENGRVLDADQLNHMEQGIFDAMDLAEQGADIDAIVDAVIASLPLYNGEVEEV